MKAFQILKTFFCNSILENSKKRLYFIIMTNPKKKSAFIRRLRIFWSRNYATLIAAVFFCTVAYWARNIEPDSLRVTELEFHHEKITPELDGTVIAFAADLHCNKRRLQLWQKTADYLNSRSDITAILLGGDLINGNNRGLKVDKAVNKLEILNDPAKVYSIPGNHEYRYYPGGIEAVVREFNNSNLNFMRDSNLVIQNSNGGKFNLIGLDFMTNPHHRIDKTRCEKLFRNDMLNIVLTHTPEDFQFLPENAHLVLAGHTHGGQINIPFLGSVINPPGYSRFENYGIIKKDRKTMYITCGLGSAYTQARLFMRPELVIIKLKMANKK